MTRPRAFLRLVASGLSVLGLAVSASQAHAATLIGGLGGPAGFGVSRMGLNDDGGTCDNFDGPGTIDLTAAFPGGLTFFGMTFHNLCINNNGNVNFSTNGTGVFTYTPQAFPVAMQRMIAPWWGDVDTRGGVLTDPSHDAVFWDVRTAQFTATWHNVGYFASHDDQQNDFQLILRSFAGCGVGSFDVEFRYHQCQWVTGDASGGHGGHGGTPTQAGFDAGDGAHYFALPGSLTESIVNLCTTSNIGDPGVWRFRIRGGELPCAGSGAMCNTGRQGACAAGTTECRMGAPVCIQNQPPSTERCDGVDNDCDGTVDNAQPGMPLCPQGFVCDRGSCVPTCVEGGCFDGQTCTMGACVDNACLSMTCPAGQRCTNGQCVDACLGIVCPIPSECHSGGCVVPCDGVTCVSGEVCDQGRCQTNCMCRACQMGYACSSDGTCQPADCIGLNCAPGQICHSALLDEPGSMARCVDPCDGAVCPQGQHCETGRCVAGSPPPDAGNPTDASGATDGNTSADGSSVDDAAPPSDGVTGDGSIVHGDTRVDGGSLMAHRGCGCRTAGAEPNGRGNGWLLAMGMSGLAVAITRRRRTRARR